VTDRVERVERLAGELSSVAVHLVRQLRRADDVLGVPPARLSALSVLVFGGQRTLSELARAEQVSGPTMSGVVGGLEAMGLVERRPHPTDRRSALLRATPKGTRLMQRGRRLRIQLLTERIDTLADLDIEELAHAVFVLRRLTGSA